VMNKEVLKVKMYVQLKIVQKRVVAATVTVAVAGTKVTGGCDTPYK